MPRIEVFEGDEETPVVSEFDFLPRVGEYLAREAGGLFQYFNVVEVWHRETATGFQSCVRVVLDD